MSNDVSYSFSDDSSRATQVTSHRKKGTHRRGGSYPTNGTTSGTAGTGDKDGEKEDSSLTYSASSSLHSGSSATDATDSSFAKIMEVLDLQDKDELGALIRGDPSSKKTPPKKPPRHPTLGDEEEEDNIIENSVFFQPAQPHSPNKQARDRTPKVKNTGHKTSPRSYEDDARRGFV
mmetsp:Transcript_19432/g.26968  ORF Transcript_19432/g.26968 Transcript_19432/m.26968 type:complete len:176 (-) Transcript_19432:370-897(-)